MSRQFEQMLVDAIHCDHDVTPGYAAREIAENWPELEMAWNLHCLMGNLISEELHEEA